MKSTQTQIVEFGNSRHRDQVIDLWRGKQYSDMKQHTIPWRCNKQENSIFYIDNYLEYV